MDDDRVFEAALEAARKEGFPEKRAIYFAKGYSTGFRDGHKRGDLFGQRNAKQRKGRMNFDWIETTGRSAIASELDNLIDDTANEFANGYAFGARGGFPRGYRLARQRCRGREGNTQRPVGRPPSLMSDSTSALMVYAIRDDDSAGTLKAIRRRTGRQEITIRDRISYFLHCMWLGSREALGIPIHLPTDDEAEQLYYRRARKLFNSGGHRTF